MGDPHGRAKCHTRRSATVATGTVRATAFIVVVQVCVSERVSEILLFAPRHVASSSASWFGSGPPGRSKPTMGYGRIIWHQGNEFGSSALLVATTLGWWLVCCGPLEVHFSGYKQPRNGPQDLAMLEVDRTTYVILLSADLRAD